MEHSVTTAKEGFSLSETQKEHINKALNAFNFKKVHAYMVLTNWKYANFNGEYKEYVPSLTELKETVRDLIIDCYKTINYDGRTDCNGMKKGHARIATGGFTVDVYDENIYVNGPYIYVNFSIEESSTY